MTDTNLLYSNYLSWWRMFREIGPGDKLKHSERVLEDAEKELNKFDKKNKMVMNSDVIAKRKILADNVTNIKDDIKVFKAIITDMDIIINKISSTGNKLYKESEYEKYVMNLRNSGLDQIMNPGIGILEDEEEYEMKKKDKLKQIAQLNRVFQNIKLKNTEIGILDDEESEESEDDE